MKILFNAVVDLTHLREPQPRVIVESSTFTKSIPLPNNVVTTDPDIVLMTGLQEALRTLAFYTEVTVYVDDPDFLAKWGCRFIPKRMDVLSDTITSIPRYSEAVAIAKRTMYRILFRQIRAYHHKVIIMRKPKEATVKKSEETKIMDTNTSKLPNVTEYGNIDTSCIDQDTEAKNYIFKIDVDTAYNTWSAKILNPNRHDSFSGTVSGMSGIYFSFKKDYIFITAVKELLRQSDLEGSFYITADDAGLLYRFEHGYMTIKFTAPISHFENESHMRTRAVYMNVLRLSRVTSKKLCILYPGEKQPKLDTGKKYRFFLQTGNGIISYESSLSYDKANAEVAKARSREKPYKTSLPVFDGTLFPNVDDPDTGYVYRDGYLCRYYKPEGTSSDTPPGHTSIISYRGPGTFYETPDALQAQYFSEKAIPGNLLTTIEDAPSDVTLTDGQANDLTDRILLQFA